MFSSEMYDVQYINRSLNQCIPGAYKILNQSRSVVFDSLRPSGTVHGILQARILEWAAVPFSRGSSNPGIESRCPILQVDSLPAEPQGKPSIPIVVRILIGIHVSTAPSVTLFFLSKVFSQAEIKGHGFPMAKVCGLN